MSTTSSTPSEPAESLAEPIVTRPKATARWHRDWYDGPVGSAQHHERLAVTAQYAAARPDPDGKPNRIDVVLTTGPGAERHLVLNRAGAEHLRHALEAALTWEDRP